MKYTFRPRRLNRATIRRQVRASSNGIPLEYTPGFGMEWLIIENPVITTSSQISMCPFTPTEPPIERNKVVPEVATPRSRCSAHSAIQTP